MEQNILESTNSQANNLNTYKSLEEINSVVFHKIKFTGNIFLVDKDYTEEKEYKSFEIIEIQEAWLKLYDQYFEKTDDTRFRKNLKNKDKNLSLLLQIKLIEDVSSLLEHLDENKGLCTSRFVFRDNLKFRK